MAHLEWIKAADPLTKMSGEFQRVILSLIQTKENVSEEEKKTGSSFIHSKVTNQTRSRSTCRFEKPVDNVKQRRYSIQASGHDTDQEKMVPGSSNTQSVKQTGHQPSNTSLSPDKNRQTATRRSRKDHFFRKKSIGPTTLQNNETSSISGIHENLSESDKLLTRATFKSITPSSKSASPDDMTESLLKSNTPTSRSSSSDNVKALLKSNSTSSRSASTDGMKSLSNRSVSTGDITSAMKSDESECIGVSKETMALLECERAPSRHESVASDIRSKSVLLIRPSSVSLPLPKIIVNSEVSHHPVPSNKEPTFRSQPKHPEHKSKLSAQKEMEQSKVSDKSTAAKLPPLRTARKQSPLPWQRDSFEFSKTNNTVNHESEEEKTDKKIHYDIKDLVNDNKLSDENFVHDSVGFKSYSKFGKRHSIDVGRILLNKERSFTMPASNRQTKGTENHKTLVNMSSRNNLFYTANELKRSIEILTHKTHLSKPTEPEQSRRGSVNYIFPDRGNATCSEGKTTLNNLGPRPTPSTSTGGRHSEERSRAKHNYPKRLSLYLSECQKDLPTSTLLEIKRLRGELY